MPKHILVVSANGGIGAAVTRAAIQRGHRVIATVSRQAKVEAFDREFPQCARVMALDLSSSDQLASAVESGLHGVAALDGVIVCGAISPFVPLETTPLDVFRETLEVNCVSHLAIYQAVMPALRRSKGRLIYTGSLSGRVAAPMQGAYVASKFALEGLVDTMRQEASRWGVSIVLLQPGFTNTPAIPRARDDLAAAIPSLPEYERALYGALYQKTLALVSAALEGEGMTDPDVVAAAAMEALEADEPATRYRIGADSDYLINASRTLSDRDIDALILKSYE